MSKEQFLTAQIGFCMPIGDEEARKEMFDKIRNWVWTELDSDSVEYTDDHTGQSYDKWGNE